MNLFRNRKKEASTSTDITAVLPTAFTALSYAPVADSTMDVAISLLQLTKVYYNAAGEFPALKNINLEFRQGEFVSIVGKSGSGKSTLLNMITGIDYPTSGDVIISGEDIFAMSESRRALWRGRTIGIVFQFFQLLPMLTLLENTMLPMDYCHIYSRSERPERAMDLLKLVGLEDEAHKLPASVSSGGQQSAAIARALATDPPIIVADEPTGNLDSHSAAKIISILDMLTGKGKTILIVTHDPEITRRTKKTLIISDGEIIDPILPSALPHLNHQQMMQATRLLEYKTVEPGGTILSQGSSVDHFFLIASGEVVVILQRRRTQEATIVTLGPGQFFGEVELLRGGNSIANVRAGSDGPVTLAALPRDGFEKLIASSPITKDALAKLVQQRVKENKSQDGRRWRRN